MGFDPALFNNKQLNMIGKADRRVIGRSAITTEEAHEHRAVRLERELHDQCLSLLRIRGIFCVHSRTDRKATTPEGTPDLVFALHGYAMAVELKRPGEEPRPEQMKVMQQMQVNGWTVAVITSLEGFKAFLDANECLCNRS